MNTKKRLEELSNQYKNMLKLDGSPVAVKMLKEPIELEGIKPRTLDKHLVICQLLSQAYYIGRTNYIDRVTTGTTDGLGCALGTACFGWRKLTAEIPRKYVGSYFVNEEQARAAIDAIPKFNENEYSSLVVAPLENCPVNPDVVVFYGNVGQMLSIFRGYLYNRGGNLTFDTTSLSACADAIITPMKLGRLNIALPCNGFRLNALPTETDLICGVPSDKLEEALEGIKFNFEGGVRYPTAWQHLDRDLSIIFPLRNYITGEPSSETQG